MRIGIVFRGAVACTIVAAVASGFARAAEQGRVIPVPLGASLNAQSGDQYFGVYVPTKFGGTLTIKTTEGEVASITGPDGREQPNGREVGSNRQGWYTFRVAGAKDNYDVSTEFVQVAEASRMPWNFYYWPTKGDAIHEPWGGGNGRVDSQAMPGSDDIQVRPYGSYVAPGDDIILPGPNGLLESQLGAGDDVTWFPNLYDDLSWRGGDGTIYSTPSPLLKYDQLFGQSARNWEAANSQNLDIQRWPGHCLGGAVASIMLNEPNPAPGTGLTKDELKALWAELGENHYNHRIGDNANNIPAGPPRPGMDATDPHVARFHAMLETHIRGRKQALLANLRAFPPTGKPAEVWNHGVGKYTAKYHAVPGQVGRLVRVELELLANSGSNLNESDPKPRRNTYEYIVLYSPDGAVDEYNTGQNDWVSVGGEAMFAPLNVMEVAESKWQGHNPMVSEANLRAMDMNNGGGGRFLTGAAPVFRPVSNYEAGRGAMIAGGSPFNGGRVEGGDSPYAPRRGGLIRGLFGR